LKKNTEYLDPNAKNQLNSIIQKILDKPDVILTELQQRTAAEERSQLNNT
jgi:hypothetical protein